MASHREKIRLEGAPKVGGLACLSLRLGDTDWLEKYMVLDEMYLC